MKIICSKCSEEMEYEHKPIWYGTSEEVFVVEPCNNSDCYKTDNEEEDNFYVERFKALSKLARELVKVVEDDRANSNLFSDAKELIRNIELEAD